MQPDDRMTQIIKLSVAIEALEADLAGRRARLAELVGSGAPAKPATPFTNGRRRKIPVLRGGLSVSQRILDYLARKPLGRNAVEIIKELELDDREAAVRSALKKHRAAGRLENIEGVWSVPKKKAPTGVGAWDGPEDQINRG